MTELERSDAILDSILVFIENEGDSSDSDSSIRELTPIFYQMRNTGRVVPLMELNFVLQMAGYLLFRSTAEVRELVIKELESLQMRINDRLTVLSAYMEN